MSLSFQEMEANIKAAQMLMNAADSPEKAEPLSLVAIARSLTVIAECVYRRELREGQ